jgi:hypothetical protein
VSSVCVCLWYVYWLTIYVHRRSKVWDTLGPRILHSEFPRNQLLPLMLIIPAKLDFCTFPTFSSPAVAKLYRDRTYARYNIPDRRVALSPPQICVNQKQKSHRFLNHDTLVQHLEKRCASQQQHCVVKGNFTLDMMSSREEVELVSNCDVYITPPGGGSFSGMFVRDGSTVIYGNLCYPLNFNLSSPIVTCKPLEAYIWDNLLWYQKRYLNAQSTQDIEFDPQDKVANMREGRQFSFHVNLAEVDKLVEEAFDNLSYYHEQNGETI